MNLGAYQFWLWKPTKDEGGARFVPTDDLPTSGFVSVYAVSACDAEAIERTRTTAGFKGVVFSTTLLVDCDTEEASNVVEGRLRQKALAYSKFLTGNRGAHFEIPRLTEPSHLLPQLDKAWVAANLPEADLSLYTHLHLIRRVGAVHEKTKERKILVHEQNGEVLTAEDYAPFRDARFASTVASQDVPSASALQCVFTDTTVMCRTVPMAEGEGRHKAMCAVAARLRELGQPIHFTEVWLANLNLLCAVPLPESEVRRIAGWAYLKG